MLGHAKTLLILLILCPLFALSKTIEVGYYTVYPHIIKPTKPGGKPSGFLIDFLEEHILHKIATKEDIIIWKGPYSIKRFLRESAKGAFDIVPLIAKNEKFSLQEFHYIDTTLYIGSPTIAVKKDFSINKITETKDLYGLSIGYYKSDKGLDHPFFSDPKLTLVPVIGPGWFERSIVMLKNERHGGLYMPEKYPLIYGLKTQNKDSKFKLLTLPGPSLYFHIGIVKKSKLAQELLKEVNKIYHKKALNYSDYILNEFKQEDK